MAITLAMFNMFNMLLFTIIITMTLTEFNMASGFALFAMLSIISLRSVNISKIEVAYLFGAITLGLINGISFRDYLLLAICNIIVLISAMVLDSEWILKPSISVDVTLDDITIAKLQDRKYVSQRITDIHQLPEISFKVKKFNDKKMSALLIAELKA